MINVDIISKHKNIVLFFNQIFIYQNFCQNRKINIKSREFIVIILLTLNFEKFQNRHNHRNFKINKHNSYRSRNFFIRVILSFI